MIVNKEMRAKRECLPEDVWAILDLFPHLHLSIGESYSYFDVHDGDNYVFIQPIPSISGNEITAEKNRKRFISWVRAGMPEGHKTYGTAWDEEE